MEHTEIIKDLALHEEMETSCKLIRLGFGELQNISSANNFYFLPFQLLSQGLERLMKSYICLGYYHKYGAYPTLKYIKDNGHDLGKLKLKIISHYFSKKERPILVNDWQFLTSDTELEELLHILSEFGKYARYHNFDIITGQSNPSINVKKLWSEFETRILMENSNLLKKVAAPEIHEEIYGDCSRYIIIIFEKLISALGRQFIFECIGQRAKQFSMPIFDFGMLYEKDFGKTNYRLDTSRFKIQPRKVHRRTAIDAWNTKFNKEYKSKKIRKKDFKGDWPFYADKVTIESRHAHWYIVSIEGNDYALNGSAKGRYKLENAHDAGMAILGKSVTDFIEIARNL